MKTKKKADVDNSEKRESGVPGGGKGRKDEVGRSGVFPVSESEGAGPDARVHGEMSWGQGERGAEGYYDHGESEISNFDSLAHDKSTKRPSGSDGQKPDDDK